MPTTSEPGVLVVFTDLDGTLLDHDTYDWSPARPALETLALREAQLVIASSKTRAEIEALRARLGVPGPFISENGGALFVPVGAPPAIVPGAREQGGQRVVAFGARRETLRAALRALAAEVGVGLRGFGDMTVEEIARRTGLSLEDAALAARREYDEPFVLERAATPGQEERLLAAARARGLRVTRGGRFHHLIGASDKGRAARALLEAWARSGRAVTSLALGDGPNDLELLEVADHAAVVARPDGSHDASLREGLPRAMFTRAAGPAGFTEGVLGLIARLGGAA
jgi:mannosyl-3-phosphoglycerate phosphatase